MPRLRGAGQRGYLLIGVYPRKSAAECTLVPAGIVQYPAWCTPKWRNGRRAGLKIRSTQVGVGSSPTFGSKDLRQICASQKPYVPPPSLRNTFSNRLV